MFFYMYKITTKEKLICTENPWGLLIIPVVSSSFGAVIVASSPRCSRCTRNPPYEQLLVGMGW
jgi:hypothetical protein